MNKSEISERTFLYNLAMRAKERIKRFTVQNQYPPSGKQHLLKPEHYRLQQRHPVLLSLLLLTFASIVGIAGFSADSVFPLFTVLGTLATLPYLSLAMVLGITGVLTSIIGTLEWVDRCSLRNAMFPQSKERSYANRN